MRHAPLEIRAVGTATAFVLLLALVETWSHARHRAEVESLWQQAVRRGYAVKVYEDRPAGVPEDRVGRYEWVEPN